MTEYRLAAFADEADRTLDGQIRALKENGIGLLEIRGADGKNVSDLTADEAKEIRKRLDGEGVSVWSIGSPVGKIEMTDDFAPHLDKFRRTLDVAHILGACHMRIFSFYHTGLPVTDALRDGVFERLSAFDEESEGSGVLLCHENEKGIYGDTARRCLEIQKAFPSMRAVFDPANFAQCGEDVPAAWRALRGYTEYLHVKDVAEDGTVVPAGRGACRVPEIVRDFLSGGGKVLTVEPHLAVFGGLSELEKAGGRTDIPYRYATGRDAFDAAVSALRELLP